MSQNGRQHPLPAGATSDQGPGRRRTAGFWLVLVLLVGVSIEASSLGGLWLLEEIGGIHYTATPYTMTSSHRRILERLVAGEATYDVHSPTLGWTVKPDGERSLYRSNAQGLRAERSYAAFPREGAIRISTFGDSFTHGNDVDFWSTWQEQLGRVAPGLEVLNFGVSGYGLGQAFLRYQEEALDFHSHVVVIGFMTEDIERGVNVFRPFYTSNTSKPMTKPRFVLQGEGLAVLENPFESPDIKVDRSYTFRKSRWR